MLVMPLAHRPLFPGERSASDAEELQARGEHPLVASGHCGLLHLLLPALISPSSATTGPATCEVPFRLAGWLSLPLLRLAEGVEGTLFYLSMVGPERMGAAIDAAMAKAGLAEATAEPVDPGRPSILLEAPRRVALRRCGGARRRLLLDGRCIRPCCAWPPSSTGSSLYFPALPPSGDRGSWRRRPSPAAARASCSSLSILLLSSRAVKQPTLTRIERKRQI